MCQVLVSGLHVLIYVSPFCFLSSSELFSFSLSLRKITVIDQLMKPMRVPCTMTVNHAHTLPTLNNSVVFPEIVLYVRLFHPKNVIQVVLGNILSSSEHLNNVPFVLTVVIFMIKIVIIVYMSQH